MPSRADAHMHLFRPGFAARLPESCRRVQPDEVTLYQVLADQYGVQQVLAVGYEGEPWAAGNNRYLAELAATHAWIRPVAYVDDLAGLEVGALETWRREAFVGTSLYLFGEQAVSALKLVPDEIWAWMVQQHWLVSVNSRGEDWAAWKPVLERHPDLNLLVSHLGLPRAVADAPSPATARQELGVVCSLARYPGVRVKLSGFYALTEPAYDYPHRAAWPYVEVLLEEFGASRLLWGSDFAPSLEWVSYPQTLGLLAEMPFLDEEDCRRIEGENLLALLGR
ncbi:MAG: L-fuconolactonase [Gaiellales bacterium]|nr:L-fuconolactonase [Gaiellales bacterium]